MYLIAECGINANGNIDIVDAMIRKAALAGADAVKFQKREIDTVYTKDFLESPRESPWGTTQREQKEGLEFSFEDYITISRICREVNIDWSASAWDLKSLEMVESFGPPWHKIASAMVTNKDFVRQVARYGRPTIISTGMQNMRDIQETLDYFLKHYNEPIHNVALLHCVSLYPCPDELCNINAIPKLRATFPTLRIGYSGHERGIEPTLMAIGLGAEIIERHFTLDRTQYGSDQAASLEPKGLALIREYGDQIEKCMGDGIKIALPEEMECARKLRWWE